MRMIDRAHWDRREIFDFFSPLSNPFYAVSFRLDVTELYRYCKVEGLSFYYAMIFLVTRAVNETEAFLYTLRDGEVFLLDRREPSFTDRHAGAKYFHIVTMPCAGSIAQFCAAAAETSRAQQGFIDYASERADLVYLSTVPWLDLTALTNERDMETTRSRASPGANTRSGMDAGPWGCRSRSTIVSSTARTSARLPNALRG